MIQHWHNTSGYLQQGNTHYYTSLFPTSFEMHRLTNSATSLTNYGISLLLPPLIHGPCIAPLVLWDRMTRLWKTIHNFVSPPCVENCVRISWFCGTRQKMQVLVLNQERMHVLVPRHPSCLCLFRCVSYTI